MTLSIFFYDANTFMIYTNDKTKFLTINENPNSYLTRKYT